MQIMSNCTKRRVEVDGWDIHYVDEYITYLGQLASLENSKTRKLVVVSRTPGRAIGP